MEVGIEIPGAKTRPYERPWSLVLRVLEGALHGTPDDLPNLCPKKKQKKISEISCTKEHEKLGQHPKPGDFWWRWRAVSLKNSARRYSIEKYAEETECGVDLD